VCFASISIHEAKLLQPIMSRQLIIDCYVMHIEVAAGLHHEKLPYAMPHKPHIYFILFFISDVQMAEIK